MIPGAREYQLARCAFREPEAFPYALITIVITLLNVANGVIFAPNKDNETLKFYAPLILVVLVSVMIMHFIYNIRVFLYYFGALL